MIETIEKKLEVKVEKVLEVKQDEKDEPNNRIIQCSTFDFLDPGGTVCYQADCLFCKTYNLLPS